MPEAPYFFRQFADTSNKWQGSFDALIKEAFRMSELMIRRNRGFSTVQPQKSEKTEKQAASSQSQKVARSPGVTVSETMQKLMTTGSRSAAHVREGRRMLQTGEAVLAEVQDSLDRMKDLAEEAGENGTADRAALQEQLEQLKEELRRIVSSAVGGGTQLFLAGDAADGAEMLPEWLVRGIAQNTLTQEQLLSALGLDKTASGAEILAAVGSGSLGSSRAVDYLAALYLGSVIAGGSSSGTVDVSQALDGLEKLLEKVSEGLSLDEAIQELTNGAFSGLEDFQNQFLDGTAPGLQQFLMDCLLSGDAAAMVEMPSLLDFLTGLGGVDLDLLMAALTTSTTDAALEMGALDGADRAADPEAVPTPVSVMRFGDVQVIGRDLSGVSFQEATGELTIGGTADVMIQGTGQGEQAILLTGSGTVAMQNVNASVVTVQSAEARIFSVGENTLAQVEMREGTALTLDGRGFLRIGAVHGDASNTLHLAGGAAAVGKENGEPPGTAGTVAVPVVVSAPASLAAQAAVVRDPGGKAMEPFDIVWKTLLPGFSSLTAVEVDGRHAKMALMNGSHADLVRLWLDKGDPSGHGSPIHALIARGRDVYGQSKTRYSYVVWNQRAGKFREVSMYPNPFVVTGGEQEKDWVYEEESQTLRILTSEVTAVSGGSGRDANQEPFSGRIALADGIGGMTLTLGGVVCRVTSGRAFYLGRENDVTLILAGGTANFFESGGGCAGISMGAGTSLRIDCTGSGGADGTLTAAGGEGSVGIGRDSGRSRDLTGQIRIHGGMITGTEKPGAAGSVTIVGGTNAGGTGIVDMGTARLWARMGVFMQVGEDTVILPQFHLSSRAMRLDRLRVSTREAAQAAMLTIEAQRREVSRVQSSYSALYRQMEQGFNVLQDSGVPGGPVRDAGAAGALMQDVRQYIPGQTAQMIRTHGRQEAENVEQLLR